MSFLIRPATSADLPAINDLYNHYVLTSTATWQLEPTTNAQRGEWFAAHVPHYPVLVATPASGTSSGEAPSILGWGSLSPFHQRPGWRFTVEDSLYVLPSHHRRGIGRGLLSQLLRLGDSLGYRSTVAVISGDQTASIRLHLALGFSHAGVIPNAGYKFQRWLSATYLLRQREPS
jgi:phosphinothricin acetyltransferase